MPYTLVIGNRNYSSWSLRAWLYLKASGEPCQVVVVPLYTDDYKQKILAYSPSGRVPCLIDDRLPSHGSIWDSLSIMEYVREQSSLPSVIDWPEDKVARAYARSISYEMHSGFLSIRDELPQNLKIQGKNLPLESLSSSCQQQVARVDEIWKNCQETYKSSSGWLFEEKMTIADVVYAPVALRFVTYGIKVSPQAQKFINAVTSNPLVQEWIEEAKKESFKLDFVDDLVPSAQSPMVL